MTQAESRLYAGPLPEKTVKQKTNNLSPAESGTFINLDGIKMTVILTAPNGVVNQDTLFHFKQQGELVTGEYEGGRIIKGFLAGISRRNSLTFTFCQVHTDRQFRSGQSACEIIFSHQGRIRIIERFSWDSPENDSGINVFEEIKA